VRPGESRCCVRNRSFSDTPELGRDKVAVQYALRGLSAPLAISTYTTHRSLPDEIRPALPSIEELTEIVRDTQHDERRSEPGHDRQLPG